MESRDHIAAVENDVQVPAAVEGPAQRVCVKRVVLCTEVDAQCDRLASVVDRRKHCQLSSTDDRGQFITASTVVELD